MPFEGRSLAEAVRSLADHLNALLVRTVTQTRLVAFAASVDPARRPSRVYLAFRQGGQQSTARLQTRFGPMRLFLGQECGSAVAEDGRHHLQILGYVYSLRPEWANQALLRWEYVSRPDDPDARWCRRHLQGPIPLQFAPAREVSLNDVHLPTGWVPIEEVLRFCIVDLGVRPLSPGWHEALAESRGLSAAAER